MEVNFRHGIDRGLPLLGSALGFGLRRLPFLAALADRGDTVEFRLGRYRMLSVNHPALIHKVLVEDAANYHKAPGLTTFGRPLLGEGLLTSDGATHQRHRKLLAPAFSPKRVALYGATMVQQTQALIGAWRPGARLDLAEEMMRVTLGIVGQTLFSVDVLGDAAVIAEAVTASMKYIMRSTAVPIDHQWPRPGAARYHQEVARLDAVVYRMIGEAKAVGGDRGDVLSMLLAARDDDGAGLSDQEIRDEVITLLLAGHETTANALAWTWQLMGQHPNWFARAKAELAEVVGPDELTVDHLARLPIGRAILQEALRLYPPAYMLAREPIAEVTVGGATLRPGEFLLIPIYGIHRRADLFADPAQFRPERFLNGKLDARHHGYMPFGAGPRVCVGNHFAMMEAQLIFSTIARAWDLALPSAASAGEALLTLRPKHGVPAQLRGRLHPSGASEPA